MGGSFVVVPGRHPKRGDVNSMSLIEVGLRVLLLKPPNVVQRPISIHQDGRLWIQQVGRSEGSRN